VFEVVGVVEGEAAEVALPDVSVEGVVTAIAGVGGVVVGAVGVVDGATCTKNAAAAAVNVDRGGEPCLRIDSISWHTRI
jgi:hypothetical protein